MLLAFTLLSGSCKKDNSPGGDNTNPGEDPLKPAADVTTTIIVQVVDERGEPLNNVSILAHGSSGTSSQTGTYEFRDINVPGNRCVVLAEKEGYFEASRAETPKENGIIDMRLVMMTKTTTHIINGSTGGKASLANGSEVQLPANALVDASGDPYTGPVNMSVRYLDPSKPDFGMLVPGGDMLAQRTDESTSVLYSYGILRVKLTGNDGEDLQVAPGKSATLVMDIPDKQLPSAPATIPLWYFHEEKGVWIEEGSATKQGDKYIGTVKHFTDWNCDVPESAATIIGRLVDCNGEPTWGHVEFGQVGEDVGSSADSDQADGTFSQRVPAGIALTVVVYDPLFIAPLLPGEQGQGKLIVMVPPLSPGQVYDVGKLQIFPCLTTIKASFKLKSADQLHYLMFESSSGGQRYIWDPANNFQMKGFPANATLTLTAKSHGGTSLIKTIQTPAAGAILDLGLLDLSNINGAYIIGKVVCGTTPLSGGQVSANWTDPLAGGKTEYDIPGADGAFSIAVELNKTIEVTMSTEKGTIKRSITTSNIPGSVVDLGTVDFCSGPEPRENSFVITGDGYNNTLKTINLRTYPASASIYTASEAITYVSVFDVTDNIRFTLSFSGKATGAVTVDDNTGIVVQIKSGTNVINYMSGFDIEGTTPQITITRYDAIGGLVEGTFQGSFVRDNGNKVTITNGKFSVIRHSDL
jgi:hypothetical protein